MAKWGREEEMSELVKGVFNTYYIARSSLGILFGLLNLITVKNGNSSFIGEETELER